MGEASADRPSGGFVGGLVGGLVGGSGRGPVRRQTGGLRLGPARLKRGPRRRLVAGVGGMAGLSLPFLLFLASCQDASWRSADRKTAKEIKEALHFSKGRLPGAGVDRDGGEALAGRRGSVAGEDSKARRFDAATKNKDDLRGVDSKFAGGAKQKVAAWPVPPGFGGVGPEKRAAKDPSPGPAERSFAYRRATAPANYGQVVPPDPRPAADDLTLHGLAGYEVVVTYAKPKRSSQKLGYLRLGTRIRVTKAQSGEGCPAGWHQLPDGAYVCASRGFVVGARPPYMKYSIVAKKDAAAPYPWAKVVAADVPMWWRPPSDKEYAATQEKRRLRRQKGAKAQLPDKLPDTQADRLPDKQPKPVVLAGARVEEAASTEPGFSGESGEQVAGNLNEAPPKPLPLAADHAWLAPGNVVSLNRLIEHNKRRYWHTARGGFIEEKSVQRYRAHDFQGVEISAEMNFPFVAFVTRKKAKAFHLGERGQLQRPRPLRHREFLRIQHRRMLGGKAWLVSDKGEWIEESSLSMPRKKAMPRGLAAWEKWIDVDLRRQMLVAYEGDRPVYLTLISSGDDRRRKSFATPEGRWRIYSKQSSSNMKGDELSGGRYWLQDVPWVMYYQGNYAIHGAFWHDRFGQRRSHGCVNVGPSDAKWLFEWTTPHLPKNWYGVRATKDAPGTMVVVSR